MQTEVFSKIKSLFTEHPTRVGESYLQHALFAMRVGGLMAMGAIAVSAHALFPFMFKRTGSNIILKLHSKLVNRHHPSV
ncbi:DUF6356 family protein [Ponticaulis koreensis]|uniref:DUF6356 family protein n=1 Tax=Ponticaulis koreensis TaxID=1123045 RepID=UPI0003B5DFBF|nr:DUF6356 family protein [Ponticaulis koreensis]